MIDVIRKCLKVMESDNRRLDEHLRRNLTPMEYNTLRSLSLQDVMATTKIGEVLDLTFDPMTDDNGIRR